MPENPRAGHSFGNEKRRSIKLRPRTDLYNKLGNKKCGVSSADLFRSFNDTPHGPSDWIRTSGLLNPIQARYQTSPHPDIFFCVAVRVRQLGYITTPSRKMQPLFPNFLKNFFRAENPLLAQVFEVMVQPFSPRSPASLFHQSARSDEYRTASSPSWPGKKDQALRMGGPVERGPQGKTPVCPAGKA